MVFHHCDIHGGEILVGVLKPTVLELGPDKSLDHPHPGNILLQDIVEAVEFSLDRQEQRP